MSRSVAAAKPLRAPLLLATLLLLSACASKPSAPPTADDADDVGVPVEIPLYLKGRYGLSPATPSTDAGERIAAAPFQNAFINEDLRAFATTDAHPAYNITGAALTVFYTVEGPQSAPVTNDTNPMDATHWVFWLGSRSIYPMFVNVRGPPSLVANQVYKADVMFDVPAPGWIVPANEPIMLLYANLITGVARPSLVPAPPSPVPPPQDNVYLLVDGNNTPALLTLTGTTTDAAVPTDLSVVSTDHVIQGNAGMFTGAAPEQVPQVLSTDVTVPVGATYAQVDVVFQSNAGGKSDLDFYLYAPNARLAASSTTPYQSETVRLFEPHLAAFGAGTYRAEVHAYSGVDTAFELRVLTNEPRN